MSVSVPPVRVSMPPVRVSMPTVEAHMDIYLPWVPTTLPNTWWHFVAFTEKAAPSTLFPVAVLSFAQASLSPVPPARLLSFGSRAVIIQGPAPWSFLASLFCPPSR